MAASAADASQQKIEVYSTLGCKHCRKAKSTLNALGLKNFVAINIDDLNADPSQLQDEGCSSGPGTGSKEVLRERFEFTKTRTVPQIYVGDDHVGGCSELLAAIETGSFSELLARHGVLAGEPVIAATTMEEHSAITSALTDEDITEKYKDFVMNNDPLGAQGETIEATPTDILQLSEQLQRKALELTDKFMSDDGARVRYGAMRSSEELNEYIYLCSTLQRYRAEDFAAADETVRFSFFSNLYNAMIVHANCVLGPPADTPAARTMFFGGKSGNRYNICGDVYTADDIEHGILRGNHRHPGQPMDATGYWHESDKRLPMTLPTLDPRVHFVLNCGASSCPPIKVLGREPEQALRLAASAYLESETALSEDGKQLVLPKLLLWYGHDFGDNQLEIVRKITSLLDSDSALRARLEAAFAGADDPQNLPCEVVFGAYNWATNEE